MHSGNSFCKALVVTSALCTLLTAGCGQGKDSRQTAVDTTKADCGPTKSTEQATLEEIDAFFAALQKTVITFVGYSGSGYEDRAAMLNAAAGVLQDFDPSDTIVNIGATPEGIGAVYELAARRGFVTTGIVSTQARKYSAKLSPCVDHVFFVEDETWGGLIDDGQRLSPTSEAMVKVSDLVVGIGGGEVARDELVGARRNGRGIRFIPADQNHRLARERAEERGLPEPASFGGAAADVF
jgi:hypothetical protein